MRRLSICLIVLAALVLPAAAQAATIVVNTTAPEAVSPSCGLLDAIEAANTETAQAGCIAGGPTNRIEFAPSALPTIVLNKKLQIQRSLEIVGPGAGKLTISGAGQFRVFQIGDGSESASLSIADLTIADGKTDETGAGMLVEPESVAHLVRVTVRDNEVDATEKVAEGAGIMTHGELTLTESTVTGNVTRNPIPTAEFEANGGGIASGKEEIEVVLDRSTVSGNTAVVEGATEKGHARGGGIFANGQTTLVVRGSTVSGNKVEINAAAENEANGGGISLYQGAPQGTIESSTIAGNTATEGANVFTKGPNSTAFRSTIVARALGGASCAGPISSSGFNLDEGSSCGFAALGDQSNVNPRLATKLALNGGPTETLALLAGSPAVDRGLAASGETTDQRGLKRPVEIPSAPNATGGDGSDVGAFEVQAPGAAIVRGPAEGATIAAAQPTFDFVADGPSSGFLCRIDGAAATPCAGPFQTPKLDNGRHTFTVAALGEAGYAGAATSRTFTVAVRTAPRAKISGVPSRTTKRRLTIRFSATQPGSTFRCKLDKRKWRSCRSPYKTPKLALGKHVFKLKASGPTGLVARTPTTKSFLVVAPRHHR